LKRERSLAVAISAVAALKEKEKEKEKDKDKDAPAASAGTVAVPSPGGPGLQRTRTRRLGASNPSFKQQPLSGSYPFTDPNAAAAVALGPRPDSSAPQSIEQLVDMSGLPAPALMSLSQPLLKGVNGRFSSGQLIALMGKSGCGKRQVEIQNILTQRTQPANCSDAQLFVLFILRARVLALFDPVFSLFSAHCWSCWPVVVRSA